MVCDFVRFICQALLFNQWCLLSRIVRFRYLGYFSLLYDVTDVHCSFLFLNFELVCLFCLLFSP